MKKLNFQSPKELVVWLMDNERQEIADRYGRKWKYVDYCFYFQDLGDPYFKGLDCLHLYATDLYGTAL